MLSITMLAMEPYFVGLGRDFERVQSISDVHFELTEFLFFVFASIGRGVSNFFIGHLCQ